MERCDVCHREDWHERYCPDNPSASAFSSVSAFSQDYKSPLFKATFDQEGEPASIQVVASNQQELEQINHELDSAVEDVRLGRTDVALTQLESVQRALYSLLR